MSTRSFRELFAEARQSDAYWEERAALDFTEAVYRRMAALGLTKSQLAERLGTSPAYVTKILGGQGNFTLKTMVRLARALESEAVVHLAHKEESAAEPVPEQAGVAEKGSANAYGAERKKRARASQPST
jgi:transcriptional regulator with XRE-family HTH domain